MLSEIENFYAKQEEPAKSCLLALKQIIFETDTNLKAYWKYQMPLFYYKNKMFCYLRIDKKSGKPYIGIVEGNKIEHPMLEKGNRTRMKILRVDPDKDIPAKEIKIILKKALEFY